MGRTRPPGLSIMTLWGLMIQRLITLLLPLLAFTSFHPVIKATDLPQPLSLQDHLSQLTSDTMVIPGDIMIADLSHQHEWSASQLCGMVMSKKAYGGVQFSMAGVYGVEKVNRNPLLLPNITLGLVMLDICRKGPPSVGQALKLVPRRDQAVESCRISLDDHRYDVVGVLGPLSSSSTLAVSSLLGFFQLPHVSPTATSAALSDRAKYGNFFRTVPPDSMQARAMVELAAAFNWTYISVIYEQSAFGYSGLTLTRKQARANGICISHAYPMSEEDVEEDHYLTIERMKKDSKARVVIVFVGAHHGIIRSFFDACQRLGVQGMFIWIFTDAVTSFVLKGYEQITLGSFLLNFYTGPNPEFATYVKSLHPRLYPNNPWLMYLWEEVVGCSPEDTMNANTTCGQRLLGSLPDFSYYSSTPTMIQAVEILSVAMDKLIKENCPRASLDKSLLSSCFKPGLLIEYLKTSSLETPSGPRGFDEYGALLQDFEVRQLVRMDGGGYEAPLVGKWSAGSLNISLKQLRWYQGQDREEAGSQVIPESVCAKPCAPGEFLIPGELSCCWECRPCRNNEIVSENNTSCEPCAALTWPDRSTYLTCLAIEPSYLSWEDGYGIALTAMAGLGLMAAVWITVTIIIHRDRKVIKGSSIHLMAVIVVGLLLIFLSVLLFIARPTLPLCLASLVGFSLSCTIVFSSLLMKTNRVYQVFKASSKFTRVGPTAKTSVSLGLVLIMLLIQIVLIAVCAIIWPISAVETMPSITTRYVERYCQQDMVGLLIPLSYNLLILLVCCVFAFLTRKLPDNFNEGWYILLCVTTTLFVWIAFLPTYFSAYYASHRVALLGLALILNGLITIVCLFVTKFYALFYINEKDIKVTDFETQNFEQPPNGRG